MRKADKIKLSVMVGVSLLAFVVGCVDTAVQPIPTTIVYKSDVSIVNLVAGTGTATVRVYHAIVDQAALDTNTLATKIDYSNAIISGTADLGSTIPTSSYQEIASGGIAVVVSYSNSAAQDTFITSANSQYKMRFFIVGDSSAGASLLKSTERYTWQTPGSAEGASLFPAGIGQIAFYNGSPDNIDITDFKITGGALDTTITLDNPDTYTGKTPYYQFAAGTYTISLWNGTDSLGTVSQSFGSQKRYTTVLYGDTTSGLQVKVLTDD